MYNNHCSLQVAKLVQRSESYNTVIYLRQIYSRYKAIKIDTILYTQLRQTPLPHCYFWF